MLLISLCFEFLTEMFIVMDDHSIENITLNDEERLVGIVSQVLYDGENQSDKINDSFEMNITSQSKIILNHLQIN